VDEEIVTCPECDTPWNLATREPCPGCGLSVDDLEAAADFLLETEVARLEWGT
jgi:hypothetical protein